MPTSQPRTLSVVYSLIQCLQPAGVVDIGVGHGKSGVLLREYLDVMPGRYQPAEWTAKIYGIEAFRTYHNPIWDYAYDKVIIGDAVEVIEQLPGIDLALALDVWEHLQPAAARALLTKCLRQAKYVLISTPRRPLAQGAIFGNEHERHVSRWSPRDFSDVRYRLITGTSLDWIFVLSDTLAIPAAARSIGSPWRQIASAIYQALNIWFGR